MAETASKRGSWVLACWLALLAGCDNSSVKDDLALTALPSSGELLRVDDVCDPRCAGDDTVDVHISYKSTGSVQQGTVDLVQYRVDYTLPGVADVPFYGGVASFTVAPGEDKVRSLLVVGSVQRDFVRRATGGAALTGTGKLTLAGYDKDNRQIFLYVGFVVRFGDETATAAPAPAGDAGGSDSGGSDAAK